MLAAIANTKALLSCRLYPQMWHKAVIVLFWETKSLAVSETWKI